MKKKLIIVGIIFVIIGVLVSVGIILNKDSKTNKKDEPNTSNQNNSNENLKELPLPELTGGTRGELGIDKNINENTIDEYLNRSDSVYRDMRMLDDPGNYESIGGDSKLSGYIKGFEIIPLPYIIPVSGLPESVGNTYQGETLFSVDSNGKYVANYQESMPIIEKYFPKDKYIFLMCGGGGYAGMTKNLLVSLGWDETKIYNVGGYWYYDGKNNIKVKKVTDNKVTYDFDSVPYINIEFSKLHKLQNSSSNSNSNLNNNSNSNKVASNSNIAKSNSNTPKSNSNANSKVILDNEYYHTTVNKKFDAINLEDYSSRNNPYDSTDPEYKSEAARLEKLLNENVLKKANMINTLVNKKASFILAVSQADICMSQVNNDARLNAIEFGRKNNIYVYDIGLLVYKQTVFYKKYKYTPLVIIVNKGEVVAYTDPNKDSDKKLYKNYSDFEKWMKKYIVIK